MTPAGSSGRVRPPRPEPIDQNAVARELFSKKSARYDLAKPWQWLLFLLRAWFAPNLQRLELENLGQSLPRAVRRFRRLESLTLSGGTLEELPDWVKRMTRLERLSVLRCPFGAFPPAILQLPLVELWIGNCPVGAVPEELGSMSALRSLHLSTCRLTSVPESLGSLEHLESLWLNDNGIEQLPSSIGKLGRLRFLHVGENALGELPETLGELCSLEQLDADRNALERLPETLGNLVWLTRLDLTHNALTALPDVFGELEVLEDLRVAENRLESLPESLGACPLKTLDARGNRLTALPDALGHRHIEALTLYGNPLDCDALGRWVLRFSGTVLPAVESPKITRVLGVLERPNTRKSELYMRYGATDEARVLWVGTCYDEVTPGPEAYHSHLPIAELAPAPTAPFRTPADAESALDAAFRAHPLALQIPGAWQPVVDPLPFDSPLAAARALVPRLAFPALARALAEACEAGSDPTQVARVAAVAYTLATLTWLPLLSPAHGPLTSGLLDGLAVAPRYPEGKHGKHDGQPEEVAVREYDRLLCEYLRNCAALAPELLRLDDAALCKRIVEDAPRAGAGREEALSALRSADSKPKEAMTALQSLVDETMSS